MSKNNKLKIVTRISSILMLLGATYLQYINLMSKTVFMIIEFIAWGLFICGFIDFIIPQKEKDNLNNTLDEIRDQSSEYFNQNDKIKLACLTIMMSLIIFIFSSCRQIKDAMLVPIKSSTVISVTKIVVMIVTFIIQPMYSSLLRFVTFKRIIYYTGGLFGAFFSAFYYFCVNSSSSAEGLLKTSLMISKKRVLGIFGWMGINVVNIVFPILHYWPYILFYIVSEIWGVIMVVTCFWQISNAFTRRDIRKGHNRFVLMICQIATLGGAYLGDFVSQISARSTYQGIRLFTYLMLGALSLLFISNYIFFKVVEEESPSNVKKKKQNTETIFSLVSRKPQYVLVALITVYYGLTLLFLEQYWKTYSLKVFYKEQISQSVGLGVTMSDKLLSSKVKTAITGHLSQFLKKQSRVAIIFSVFGPHYLSKILNWTGFAISTPVLVLLGVFVILGSAVLRSFVSFMPGANTPFIIGMSTVILAVIKTSKYILFDSSREAYNTSKSKEVAREIKNLQGMFSRMGKAMGSIIIVIFGLFGKYFDSRIFIVTVFLLSILMCLAWLGTTIFIMAPEIKESEKNKNIVN